MTSDAWVFHVSRPFAYDVPLFEDRATSRHPQWLATENDRQRDPRRIHSRLSPSMHAVGVLHTTLATVCITTCPNRLGLRLHIPSPKAEKKLPWMGPGGCLDLAEKGGLKGRLERGDRSCLQWSFPFEGGRNRRGATQAAHDGSAHDERTRNASTTMARSIGRVRGCGGDVPEAVQLAGGRKGAWKVACRSCAGGRVG